ncbi:hypothetical protein BDV41DRAFT_577250 [Aspergillus transmontanensis]|uniref:O-methyltransferase C-terminal domain-containing protein n=1 Tax=Aspergillus transmontanensis TaxID=1034304 RepID=A0A5N6VX22_9EURO|nr:hypothetical protein BDV41DRAFT_577250 [Aspergillus transmontanensis]
MVEAWLLNIAEEYWPAFTRTVDATEGWPGSKEPNETGYSLAFNANKSPFDGISKDLHRQVQFIPAIRFSNLHPSYHLSHLLDNYGSGTGECTIVDLGGSHGDISTEIASRYPQIRCIVQDLPGMIADWTD